MSDETLPAPADAKLVQFAPNVGAGLAGSTTTAVASEPVEEAAVDITKIPSGTPIPLRKEELEVIVVGVQDALEALEAAEELVPDEYRAVLKLLAEAIGALEEAQEMGVSVFETVIKGGNTAFETTLPPPTNGLGSEAS